MVKKMIFFNFSDYKAPLNLRILPKIMKKRMKEKAFHIHEMLFKRQKKGFADNRSVI